MKNIVLIFIILAQLFGCGNQTVKTSSQQVLYKLKHLNEVQDYFKLKKLFTLKKNELSKEHLLFFSSIINNVFNKAEKSNEDIQKLIIGSVTTLNDTMLNKLYRTKLLNHINLYEYGEAALTSEYIQKNYQALNDSVDLEMFRNEINIWRALKDIPKQEIIKDKDITIPMVKDKVGLFNIDVSFGDKTLNLLFDTGANFSAIKRSLVSELGLKLIEADFYVTAATGTQVKSDIAIAEKIKIGDLTVKNAVFLVLNDEDISFPQIDYYINGAIGFPVIEAMNEIRINKENQIFVPNKPLEYSFNNFALDGLMPILAGEYNGDTLRFHFDTGATRTSLFPQFFKENQQDIVNSYKKETFKSGSGGGIVEFEGYIINDFNLKIADSSATIDSVRLHIENIGGEENNFHGNFGQDYINQFDEMIISFKYSSVLFK